MKTKSMFLTPGLLMIANGAKAEATAKQSNEGMIEVIKFMSSKGIEVRSVEFYDEHDYDGELSSIEYEVIFFKNNKTCKQVLAVEAWPSISPINESNQEDPKCK